MDVKTIRKDFPILDTGIIYLDSAASSLTPKPVVQKMDEYYHQYRANIARGVHRLSQHASSEYEAVRGKVASFINAAHSDEIIMTKNTTEGINIIASGLNWRPGDRIVTTLLEHNSNYVVWLRLKKKYSIDVQIVRPDEKGYLSLDDFERVIDGRTRLVALAHASNVLGVINPVKEVAELAHHRGALILVDGAQSVPHIKSDVRDMNCDFLAFSGHKMCGPTGSGVLYIKSGLEDKIEPLMIGGGTITDVGIDYYSLAKSPEKFEAGTPAIADVIGFGKALDYLEKIGMENIRSHEARLIARMYDGLLQIPKIIVYGPEPKHRVGVLSFNVADLNPHDVALALDVSSNIMVRSGLHCTYPVMKEVIHAPSGSVRASVYLYNTDEEVDSFLSAVREISSSLS